MKSRFIDIFSRRVAPGDPCREYVAGTREDRQVAGGPWDSHRSYDELPLLPPRGDLETKVVLKQCVAARPALAQFEQASRLVPNPSMLAHYPFEAIHPYTDGYGRTGRVLNSLYLVEGGMIGLPILYLSRYIIGHKHEYHRLLLAVTREQAREPWLLYMLRAVEETTSWTLEKIGAIRDLREHTTEHVRRRLPKIFTRELIDVIFEQPHCRIRNLQKAGIAKRQAASRYLKALVGIGVLREEASGREKLFVHPRLVRLLTRDMNAFEPYF
jgi:hypothetical protein